MPVSIEDCPDCGRRALYVGRNSDYEKIYRCVFCKTRWMVDSIGRWSNKTVEEDAPVSLKTPAELRAEELAEQERLRAEERRKSAEKSESEKPYPPFYPSSGGKKMSEPSLEKRRAKKWLVNHFGGVLIIVTILIVSLLVVTLLSFVNVPAGYKGVVVSAPRNSYIGHTFDEGWHFNPYLILCDVEIIRYNTQTIEYSVVVAGDELSNYGPVTVRSLDNLELDVSFSLTFHIPAEEVSNLRIQYGDIEQTLIMQVARSTPRDIASHYAGLDMAGPLRPAFEAQVSQNITERLAEYSIIVEMVNLRSINLPDEVDMAVQQKKVAEQEYIAAEYQANRTIVLAQGQAQAVIINATAHANAIWIMANGSAEAINTIITQMQLNDPNANVTDYLTWLYLQALIDPNSNIQWIIVTDGTGTPIIIQPQTPTGG